MTRRKKSLDNSVETRSRSDLSTCVRLVGFIELLQPEFKRCSTFFFACASDSMTDGLQEFTSEEKRAVKYCGAPGAGRHKRT